MHSETLTQRLERLLAEPLDEVRKRQEQTLDRLLGGLDQPFILFGAGNLGRKALAVLQAMGVKPQAFIDNNPALWGTQIEQVPVFAPAMLAQQWQGPLPGVIATIWCGEATDQMADRLGPLHTLGFERIALFGHLAWRYPESFLPHYFLDLPEKVIAEAGRILQAFEQLADEESRRLFVDHIEWRLFLEHDLLPPAAPHTIYFDDKFSTAIVDEVVYDIGAFDGDSVRAYLETARPLREMHSFEPSSVNYDALRSTIARLPKSRGVHAHRLAVGDASGDLFVETRGGPAARVSSSGERVLVTTMDELCERIAAPTFIKIDIEGFEPQCLMGGRRLIERLHPVIAVCVYHEQDHLWSILLQLHTYYSGYRFSLCQHLAEGWDLVLYAVPADRFPPHSSCE